MTGAACEGHRISYGFRCNLPATRFLHIVSLAKAGRPPLLAFCQQHVEALLGTGFQLWKEVSLEEYVLSQVMEG